MTDKLAFDVGLQEDAIGTGAVGRRCDGDTTAGNLGTESLQESGSGQTWGTLELRVWGCGWTYSGQRGLGGHGGTLGRESEGENGKLRQK